MNKILQIAWREFHATVTTKGFLIGLLVLPLMLAVMIVLMPRFMQQKAPRIVGEVAVLDDDGTLIAHARDALSQRAFAERRRSMQERMDAAMPAPMRSLAGSKVVTDPVDRGLDQLFGEVPDLTIVPLQTDTDLAAQKKLLAGEDEGRLALIVVHRDAVQAADGAPLGTYDLYVRDRIDDRLVDELRDGMKNALIEARLSARALDPQTIRELTRVGYVPARKIDASGERTTNEVVRTLLPMAFMVLMLVAVMTAGQQLMTSTIEEKSSRVVELLLAAVSPTELMAGKILGQLAIASLMLALYGGIGLLLLASFAAFGLLDPWLLVYLVVYFLIAFVVLSALMAAIGAAVNELREAQALLTPVILLVMLPMMLWLPISRDPNSLLATGLSLLPPVSPFVMMLRLTSSVPPPAWQIALSIVLGIAAVFASIWFAGKVFRIGLLMHGKPPNLITLLRWARMA